MDYQISVIIPIYNVEPYILECLQSVANQTIACGLECILVDDCGTDNSVAIAEQFVSSYQGDIHFSLIHHKENRGLSAARNTGIKCSGGKYLYFLDSDDIIKPSCLDKLYFLGEKYQADMVQGSYESNLAYMKHFEDNQLPEFSDDKSFIKRILLNYDVNPVMAQNRLILRNFVLVNNLYFKEGIIHEDNYWTFFLAKYVGRMAICKEKVYNYRSTPGSITNKVNLEKEASAFHTMIEDFSSHIDPFERNAQKRIIFCLLLGAIGAGYYRDNGDRKLLIDSLKKQDTFINRILLSLIFCMESSYVRSKLVNLLMKIYQKG